MTAEQVNNYYTYQDMVIDFVYAQSLKESAGQLEWFIDG